MSFLDLLRAPGVEEVLELGSRFGLLAFHGGLEGGTVEIAAEAAAQSGASLYMVVQPPDLRWHVPSHRVGADASPALARFLDHVDVAIALHGYGRRGRPVDLLLGGGNRTLAATLAGHLRAALPGYLVIDDLDLVPPEMRGLHASNPVNQPAHGGVQLELPPRIRGSWPATSDAPARPPTPHPGIVAALVATISAYLQAPSAAGTRPGWPWSVVDPKGRVSGTPSDPKRELPVTLAEVIDDHFLEKYRCLLDAEDAAFDELEHAYEEGDRAHFESDLAAWQEAIERKLSYLRRLGVDVGGFVTT